MRKLKLFSREQVGNASDTGRQYSRPDSLSLVSRQSVLAFLLVLLTTIFGVGNAWGEETVTYQHVFNQKPSTGNGVTLSKVNWNVKATNLGNYNSGNYAGVQIGTSSKNGSITLTSVESWGASGTYKDKTKITEVRLWLNLGGTSVTPTVTIGGKATTSDGTKVVINKQAGTDWTKATKVTFTPAADGNTGVVVINVSTVKAGYICAMEIDCEPASSGSGGTPKPTVSVTPENITWEGIAASAEKSEEITVTLSNIEAVMAELSGDNPTAFSIDKYLLEASGTIVVSKNTTTIGNYAATLTISDAATQTKNIALSMEVVADPEPTGTFEKFTGTIEEGDYVLVANGTTDALKNTITSDRFDCGTVEVTENKIVNPDKSVIWHIAANDAYWTMYNESTTSYAGGTTSKNQGALLDAVTDLAKWTITVDGEGVYTFENYGRSQQKSDSGNKFLSKNSSASYWATYASGQKNPVLYKKHVDVAVEKPTISGETSFLTSTTVTLACETEGATIYYTTDESDPMTSETKQTGTSFTLYNSATVRAIAYKGGDWSAEATSKTFTKITPDYTTIAAFLSEKPNEDKYIQFAGNVVVTGVNGKNVFIQDESGNAICLYFATAPSPAWTKGHKVTGMFQAKYATYGNMPEMSIADGNEGTIAATETADIPAPTEITSLAEATINANMCKYVVLKGVYFQGQSLTNKTVNLQDASSNVLKFYDNLSLTEGKALPLTATACDVTGVLISYKSGKDNINEILPVDDACINAGAAALPTLSTAGSTDEEHPTMVANGENITITPAEGFTSTLNGEPLNAAKNINITETESNTVIAVSASRDYYAPANATYYFKANPAGTKYAITVVQPEQGGTLEANFAETEAGNPVTLTATPTNSHFTFDGWVVKKTGEPEASPETVMENQFSMPEYDVTVTGSFTEDAKATLTFAKGDADGEEEAPGNIVDYIGETIQMPANPFTYKGHKFAGWSCDGGTTKLAAEANYVLAEDKEFVAQWDEIPTFDDPNYEWQLVTSNAQLVAGKYYVIASTAKGKVMSNTISNSIAGEIAATFTDGVIAYNAFGSSQSADVAGVAVLQLGVEEGAWTLTEVVANDALLGATAAKKIVWGSGTTTWSISFANNNATIQNGTNTYGRILHNVNDTRFTTYTSNTSASMVLPQLYVWVEKVYKLRYDANGGENAPAAQAANGEGKATVTDAKPTYTDHIFKEWNTLVDGNGEAKAAGDVIDLSEGDVTLYAQWREPETYNISYDANGGTLIGGESEITPTSVTEGNLYTIEENVYEVEGKLFIGWKANGVTYNAGQEIYPTENMTFVAQWGDPNVTDFMLVTDVKQLKDGDKVYIVAAEHNVAMGTQNDGNYRNYVEIAKQNNRVVILNATPVEFTVGKVDDNFTFNDGTGFLYASSSDKNYLNTEADLDDNGKWAITIDAEGVASIIAQGTNSRKDMRYNASSGQERFSCYATSTTMKAVSIYKRPDYSRNVSGNYATICLPKAGKIIGATLYEIAYYGETSKKIFFDEIVNGEMEAGIPYIFQPAAGVEKINVYYSDNTAEDVVARDRNGLIGFYDLYDPAARYDIDQDAGFYILYNNQYWLVSGREAYVENYRAYIELNQITPFEPTLAPGRRRISMSVNDTQTTTGFENAEANEAPHKVLINGELFILRGEKMYDAKGQLVK